MPVLIERKYQCATCGAEIIKWDNKERKFCNSICTDHWHNSYKRGKPVGKLKERLIREGKDATKLPDVR